MPHEIDPELEPFLEHICRIYINLRAHGHTGETLDYFDDEDRMDESLCQISFSIKQDLIDVDVNFKESLTKQEKIMILQQIIMNLRQQLFDIICDSTPLSIH